MPEIKRKRPGLVLTRKPGERVILTTPEGRRVSILVEECSGKVRLRFSGDRSVTIVRAELISDSEEIETVWGNV